MKRIFTLITSIALAAGLFVAVSLPASVQAAVDTASSKSLCEGSGGTWNGTACTRAGEQTLPQSLASITNLLLFIIGVIAVIVVIIGGIRYVTSSGDPAATKTAKDTVLYALIGIVVAFLAYAIVNFVTAQFK